MRWGIGEVRALGLPCLVIVTAVFSYYLIAMRKQIKTNNNSKKQTNKNPNLRETTQEGRISLTYSSSCGPSWQGRLRGKDGRRLDILDM